MTGPDGDCWCLPGRPGVRLVSRGARWTRLAGPEIELCVPAWGECQEGVSSAAGKVGSSKR